MVAAVAIAVHEDPLALALGEDLAVAIADAGISQKSAAIDGGISESKLADMIHGRRPIPLHFVVRLGLAHPTFLWYFVPCVFDRRAA